MRSYIPATREEQARMLESMGLSSMEELLRDIPQGVRLNRPLDLPEGRSEAEVLRALRGYAAENHTERPMFRGAGAYRHFIPAIVDALTERGEFLTAYTPYQPEMSQGMLQAIFEYQTLIARLCGMDASNASVYDGATAAAEAMLMCRDSTRRKKMLVSLSLHPDVLAVLRTYAPCAGVELVEIPLENGVTDVRAVAEHAEGAAGLIAPSPNYFGLLEDTAALAQAHPCRARPDGQLCKPHCDGHLQKAGRAGRGHCRGRRPAAGPAAELGRAVCGLYGRQAALPAQPAGPHCRRNGGRCGPARLCIDPAGARAAYPAGKGHQQYLLQPVPVRHPRGAVPDRHGPRRTARNRGELPAKGALCAEGICSLHGMRLRYSGPFFHEFVVDSDRPAAQIDEALREMGIVGGLPLDAHGILYCVDGNEYPQGN